MKKTSEALCLMEDSLLCTENCKTAASKVIVVLNINLEQIYKKYILRWP